MVLYPIYNKSMINNFCRGSYSIVLKIRVIGFVFILFTPTKRALFSQCNILLVSMWQHCIEITRCRLQKLNNVLKYGWNTYRFLSKNAFQILYLTYHVIHYNNNLPFSYVHKNDYPVYCFKNIMLYSVISFVTFTYYNKLTNSDYLLPSYFEKNFGKMYQFDILISFTHVACVYNEYLNWNMLEK